MTLFNTVVTENCILMGADSSSTVDEAFDFAAPSVFVSNEKVLATGLKTIRWGFSKHYVAPGP